MDKLNHYLRPPTRIVLTLVACSVAAVLVVSGLCYQALKMRAAAADAEQRAATISAMQAIRPVVKKSREGVEEQRKWAALRVERDFSWAEIFASVERAGSAEIELLAFKPDKGNRIVLLSGEARDQKSLIVFLDTLAQQPNLKNVHLTLQQRKKRERLETILFEIRANFSG